MPVESPQPVLFQETHDALVGMRFPTLDHATFYGCAFDLSCWLRALGFDAGRGIEKIGELVPDLEPIILRHDGTAIMLTCDDARGIRLFVGDRADDPKLVEAEARSVDAEHSLIVIIPERIRAWLAPRYSNATRH